MAHPLLYEINTRCWLREASARAGRPATLADVPEAEFKRWEQRGFTHLWLMGVWPTGPRSRAQALSHPDLRRAYDAVLPGWSEADVAGSPYAVAEYRVAAELGGEIGLATFRRELHRRGLKLILDFVGNHVGLDHPWVREHPDFFVQSAQERAGVFREQTVDGPRWLAHGKDPYFDPWTDTVQLDYRHSATRAAINGLLADLSARCDGLRCDMAMLELRDVFARTWADFPVSEPADAGEFWADAIAAVRRGHPDFLFLAEAYWGLEQRLLDLGFDYAYDKTLYDGLMHRDAAGVHRHLYGESPALTAASSHFLETHDEPRAAALLNLAEHQAAALLVLGLPGLRFLHEGQLEGARFKIPVQITRRPLEAGSAQIESIYQRLLKVLPATSIGRGTWRLLSPLAAWPDNPTGQNFVVVEWRLDDHRFDLVVVNLAAHASQCYVSLSVQPTSCPVWSVRDLLGSEDHERSAAELAGRGLYLDLPAQGAQILRVEPRDLTTAISEDR